MNITPLRGLNLRGTHAAAGHPVEVDDKLGKELLVLGVAERTPPEKIAPAAPPVPAPIVETASAAPAAETATAPAAAPKAAPKKTGTIKS